jgi:hypothetical protein
VRFLLDINIWLDIAARPKKFPESGDLYRLLELRHEEICFALCGYTTFHYLLKQVLGASAALEFCRLLRQRSVKLLSFAGEEVATALGLDFADHEDACIAATALTHQCDYIITRNLSDFRKSPIKPLAPSMGVKMLRR